MDTCFCEELGHPRLLFEFIFTLSILQQINFKNNSWISNIVI